MGNLSATNTTLVPPNSSDFPQGNNTTRTPSGTNSAGNTIFISVMSFVIAAGFIGNVLVIITICCRRSMKTPCNLFIMNIAIADLLVAIILTPLRVAEHFYGWPLGEFLCQFFGPLQDAIVCVSVVTHTVIAFERYRGIVTPFKTKLSLHRAKVVTVITWGMCYLATGLPLALVLRQVETRGNKRCKAQWPSITSRRIFEVYLVSFFIALPLILQTVTYSKIVETIRQEDVSDHLISRSGTIEQRKNQLRKKTRLIKMLIILVAVFQLCYVPRGIFILLYEFVSEEYKREHEAGLSDGATATIILYYLKHVINPFILFAMSTEFRKNCYPRVCGKGVMEGAGSSVSGYFSQQGGSRKSPFKQTEVVKVTCKTVQEDNDRETNL